MCVTTGHTSFIELVYIDTVCRAGNWWEITTRNRTTVHYGEPLQTVVDNCNPLFTRHTK